MSNQPETRPEFYFPEDEDSWVSGLFSGIEQVWDGVSQIARYVKEMITDSVAPAGLVPPGIILHDGMITTDAPVRVSEDVLLPHLQILIQTETVLEPGVLIKSGTIIGKGVEIRQGAYLRGRVVIADGAVVGHVTEVKNSVFFAGAEAGHFAYVGDSILGRRVNLGAGTKLANLPLRAPQQKVGEALNPVMLNAGGKSWDTGLPKLGAILGDDVEIGCNTVTSPGTLVGPRTWIYPTTSIRKGFYPADIIIRSKSRILETISKKK